MSGVSGRLTFRQKAIVLLLAGVNLVILVVLTGFLYGFVFAPGERPIAALFSRDPPLPTPRLTFPPTWTATPTSTPRPSRPATQTPTARPTSTPAALPTSTSALPRLTLAIPVAEQQERDRLDRIHIIEAAAQKYHDKFPVVVLLAIAALESQGTFSNRVADHGVMGVTPKAGRCYTLVYEDTERDLQQNVADAACHLNGYAWERAAQPDGEGAIKTTRIKRAILEAGLGDYMAQVVAAVHWYAGETQPEYLVALADIIEGRVDEARSVPGTFGAGYQNSTLAEAFRIGYRGLTSP